MTSKQLLSEAKSNTDIIDIRRKLHQTPETGFNLTNTISIIKSELNRIGITPTDCGKSGICALINGKKSGKVFLLRADMDALPIKEETALPFCSQNGNMHACGHDMHTAMLLGAARLLKSHEQDFCGTVKLMFQPAEELLAGARDMISAGVLQNPTPDYALMLHVMTGTPFQTGTLIVSAPGISAPAADYFEIKVLGTSAHGATPDLGVDSLTAASHILIALQEICARELSFADKSVITIGQLHSGNAANILPAVSTMHGSIRSFDEDTRDFIKKRISEISHSVAKAFRAKAEVTFQNGAPTLINDTRLSKSIKEYMTEMLGENMVISSTENPPKATGSEDFSYISHKIPSVMIAISAGTPENGYQHPPHHPKATFDETALFTGSAVYAYSAIKHLNHVK